MKNSQKIASVLSMAVLGLTAAIPEVQAQRPPLEKCADIVKKGKNACEANGHSCAAQSTHDNQKDEWILVPEGTCANIVTVCNDKTLHTVTTGISEKKAKRICSKVAEQTDPKVKGGRVL